MPEGGTRAETDGAVGSRRRRVRGDAGEDGRLEAGTREPWGLATGRMFTRENKHGRIGMGEYIREESVKREIAVRLPRENTTFPG